MHSRTAKILLLIALCFLLAVAVDAQNCGPTGGGAVCSQECCSEYGWCGKGDAWCGTGCQQGFGLCNGDPPTTTTTTQPTQTPGPVTANVYSTCSESNSFALTFDDGPYEFTGELLDYLASRGQKVTFFVNGFNYGCIYDYADVLQRAYSEGHQIGSHTWSHPDLQKLSDSEIKTEMTRLEGAFRKILGVVPRFMRLPYGDGESDSRVLGILGELGYSHIIQWDLDSGDSIGYSSDQSKAQYDNLDFPEPHIALNHDVHADTVRIVAPYAIDSILNDGYEMQTVGSCLGTDSWYKEIGSASERDDTWQC